MSGLTITLEDEGVMAALARLGDVAQPYVNAASAETARAIVVEAKARLSRQLGPEATGRTVAAIQSRPAYDNNGSVVVVEREPMPNLPLWLEKGTKYGTRKGNAGGNMRARPYFYSSIALEVGAHERRIADAVQQAIEAEGLGD